MNNFRLINTIEKSIINNSLQKFSTGVLLFVKQENYKIYIFFNNVKKEIDFPSIYLVSRENGTILEEVLKNENVISVGIYFGFIKRGEFHLSLEGAEFFFKKSMIQDQNILRVNNKGERAILYGNPILKEMVVGIPSEMQKNALMLVLNESKEFIALVISQIDYTRYQLLNQEELVAINLADKGYYLRKMQ